MYFVFVLCWWYYSCNLTLLRSNFRGLCLHQECNSDIVYRQSRTTYYVYLIRLSQEHNFDGVSQSISTQFVPCEYAIRSSATIAKQIWSISMFSAKRDTITMSRAQNVMFQLRRVSKIVFTPRLRRCHTTIAPSSRLLRLDQ